MAGKNIFNRRLIKVAAALGKKENVIGLAHGVKMVGGRVTRRRCIAVFVRKKVPVSRLDPRHRLPKTIIIDGERFLLDVVPVGKMAPQTTAFGDGLSCDNYAGGRLFGTRSAYFQVQNQIQALSCAHVIWGAAQQPPNPPVSVSAYDDSQQPHGWNPFGSSNQTGVISQGNQLTVDWGYIDCAAASIRAEIQNGIQLGQPLNCFSGVTANDFFLMSGTNVTGSGMRTPSCAGQIVQVHAMPLDADGFWADFVIHPRSATDTLTQPGDSGMLWQMDDGTVVGMHCMGNVTDDGSPSTVAVGTFIQRITSALGIGAIYNVPAFSS